MKTKKFSLLQLFSITNGRLSTKIEDVYDILNHVCDTNLITHKLPSEVAMNYVKEKNPKWFKKVQSTLNQIGVTKGAKFEYAIKLIKSGKNNKTFNIPQLKDEFDTSDFGDFMIENSLILNKK